MDKKKILFIAGIALIVILGIIAIFIGKKEVKSKEDYNINKNVLKDTTMENFTITDQSVITRDGLSTYMANLTNNTKEKKHIDYLHIVFTIDDETIDVIASKNSDVDPEGKLPIMISFDRDISKATKVTYKITKEEK